VQGLSTKKSDVWNVANVTGMSEMSSRATAFKQDIGSSNVVNVTNMESMFVGGNAFNQEIEVGIS
jgi:hypothetical protein